MPDLATHVAAAWTAGRLVSWVRPFPARGVYLFACGSALPDLLARAPHLVLESNLVEFLTRPLHTPAALFLVSFALSFLFEERQRAWTFGAIFLGALFHCFLDFFQEVGPSYGYGWFYPVSLASPQLPLFSGDETALYLPYLAASGVLVELLHRLLFAGRGGR